MRITCCILGISAAIIITACNRDPKAASQRYVASGNRYFAKGQYKEASILYRRALGKDLRSGDAWYRLGVVNVKLGELPEARKDFSRAMGLDSSNLDAVVQLGNLDLAFYLLDPRGGHAFLADLKEITDRLLKKDPRSFDGLRFSGNIALAANDTANAILKFEQANLVKPDQPDLTLTLVQTLFASKRDEEGEALAAKAIERQKAFAPLYEALYIHYMRAKRPELAEQVLQRRTANNPKQAECLVGLAFHYFLMHRAGDVRATIERLVSDPRGFPDGRLAAGDFYVRVRDYQAALTQYQEGERQSLAANSKALVRLYRTKMAEVLGTLGARDEAGRIVAGLLKQDSKDPEALALDATLMLASGDSQKIRAAIAELQPLVARLPKNATLHFNLARAYASQQNQEKAIQEFEAALRLDPHHAPAKLALAELALGRGELARTVDATTQVLNEDATNLSARLMRAAAYLKMSELEKSRDDLNAALQLDPASSQTRAQLADLDFLQHRYQAAEDGYRALFRAGDARGAPGFLKAQIAQGKIEPAVEFASSQVKASPDRTDRRLALAEILIAAHQYNAAAMQFQQLIDRNPKSPDLYIQLGEAKLRGSDTAGAEAAFQTARQLAPADARPILDLALLYDRTGRSGQARKEYETVIQLQPENATALNNLAFLEAEEGVNLDQALALAQRAQQRMPHDLDVQDTLALVYVRKNLTNDGIRMLRDLVARRPNSAPFHLHLALALYQKGDRPLAKRELENALRHQPTAKEQNTIKELIAKVG